MNASGSAETSIPRSSSSPRCVAAVCTMSILVVLTWNPCETWYVVLVRCLLIRVTWTFVCTTCGRIAWAAMPDPRRNATTARLSCCSAWAAAIGVAARPSTLSVHCTRFELIGFRAEPVTVIVSFACFASWIVVAKTCAIHTAATASASSPRNSSGIAIEVRLPVTCGQSLRPVQDRFSRG